MKKLKKHLTVLALSSFFALSTYAKAEPEPVQKKVRSYPNFAGGIHGNPAAWQLYGNLGSIELGRTSQGNRLVLMFSNKFIRDIHGLVQVDIASPKKPLEVTGLLSFPLFLDLYLGAEVRSSIDGSVQSKAGILYAFKSDQFLLRAGVDCDLSLELLRTGAETRFLIDEIEITLSGNSSLSFKGSNVMHGGQRAGIQVALDSHVISFSTGGPTINVWNAFSLHYRFLATDSIFIDLFLRGTGTDLFVHPDYGGVGVRYRW